VTTNGIHITASQPVSVYGLNFFEWYTVAFTGYPTPMLGTNYCLIARPGLCSNPGVYSQFAIVATASNTTVTITPSATAQLVNHTNSYSKSLQQGETYQINSQYITSDVSGARVASDKPIAVFAGASIAFVPTSTNSSGNPLVAEQLPLVSWRTQALALSFDRFGGDSFRVLAASNDTVVTTNGVVATNLPAGQFFDAILAGPVEFQGSSPIQVAQFAQGGQMVTTNIGYGDPCEILLPPTAHYLTSYTIAIPPDDGQTGDFTANFLNLIVPQSAISTTLVDGALVSATNFVAISSSDYSGARVSVTAGPHTISSSEPIEVEVYGFGYADAYAYIGGITSLP
jgi:hypothetical protein